MKWFNFSLLLLVFFALSCQTTKNSITASDGVKYFVWLSQASSQDWRYIKDDMNKTLDNPRETFLAMKHTFTPDYAGYCSKKNADKILNEVFNSAGYPDNMKKYGIDKAHDEGELFFPYLRGGLMYYLYYSTTFNWEEQYGTGYTP